MKLLFDHNLSHKLCRRLLDLPPNSSQTRMLSFTTASDQTIWEHAKINEFIVVTLDKDFSDLAMLRGGAASSFTSRCNQMSSYMIAGLRCSSLGKSGFPVLKFKNCYRIRVEEHGSQHWAISRGFIKLMPDPSYRQLVEAHVEDADPDIAKAATAARNSLKRQ